ncbi:MAG: hypothetical protein JNL67_21895 [Planctomycetaceae bacterium]|nr:hypothetical protein [Planctomycetaceae bacterium]
MAASFWQTVWWSYFAQLPEDRVCYRLIQKHKYVSILEIGMEDAVRSERMLQIALRTAGPRVVNFVGIDLFEAHPKADEEQLTLKAAHQLLSGTGARVKLVPGDAHSALSRTANSLKDIELVVIGWDNSPEVMAKCWNLMPRFLAENATILLQGGEEEKFQFKTLTVDDIKQRAAEQGKIKPSKAA